MVEVSWGISLFTRGVRASKTGEARGNPTVSDPGLEWGLRWHQRPQYCRRCVRTSRCCQTNLPLRCCFSIAGRGGSGLNTSLSSRSSVWQFALVVSGVNPTRCAPWEAQAIGIATEHGAMGGIAGLCKPAEVEWCTQCIIWRCLSLDACPWVMPGDTCSVAVRYRTWSSLPVNRLEAENASGGGGVVEQARVSCPLRRAHPPRSPLRGHWFCGARRTGRTLLLATRQWKAAVHAFARWRPEPPPRAGHVCLMCFPVLWLSGARPDCRSLQG